MASAQMAGPLCLLMNGSMAAAANECLIRAFFSTRIIFGGVFVWLASRRKPTTLSMRRLVPFVVCLELRDVLLPANSAIDAHVSGMFLKCTFAFLAVLFIIATLFIGILMMSFSLPKSGACIVPKWRAGGSSGILEVANGD